MKCRYEHDVIMESIKAYMAEMEPKDAAVWLTKIYESVLEVLHEDGGGVVAGRR